MLRTVKILDSVIHKANLSTGISVGTILHKDKDGILKLPQDYLDGFPYISNNTVIPNSGTVNIEAYECFPGSRYRVYSIDTFEIGDLVYYDTLGEINSSTHIGEYFLKYIGRAETDSNTEGNFILRVVA